MDNNAAVSQYVGHSAEEMQLGVLVICCHVVLLFCVGQHVMHRQRQSQEEEGQGHDSDSQGHGSGSIL